MSHQMSKSVLFVEAEGSGLCDAHTHSSPLGKWVQSLGWCHGPTGPGPKTGGTDQQRKLGGEVGSDPLWVCHDLQHGHCGLPGGLDGS